MSAEPPIHGDAAALSTSAAPVPGATGGLRQGILSDAALAERLARIKLFLCDVDGVLTDAGVYIGGAEETKRFNMRDGLGLRLLQREGLKTGWISNRYSIATRKRGEELRVDFLHQEEMDKGPGMKLRTVEGLLRTTGLDWTEVLYMGDDLIDLAVLKRCGVAVAVANAIAEVKAIADYVTAARGGDGAVREVVELVLKARGRWDAIIASYTE